MASNCCILTVFNVSPNYTRKYIVTHVLLEENEVHLGCQLQLCHLFHRQEDHPPRTDGCRPLAGGSGHRRAASPCPVTPWSCDLRHASRLWASCPSDGKVGCSFPRGAAVTVAALLLEATRGQCAPRSPHLGHSQVNFPENGYIHPSALPFSLQVKLEKYVTEINFKCGFSWKEEACCV